MPGTHTLVAQHSGKAAEINGASTAVGAGLVQRTLTNRTNQQFEFVTAADGYVKLKARHSGLFLQPTGTTNGANVVQQADSTATGQQWRVVDHGSNVISLVNRESGLALDVWEYLTTDGARRSRRSSSSSELWILSALCRRLTDRRDDHGHQ